ncbi:MAG TPA: DUF3325 family protein [Methylophaga aminisulfidivorans]|uniref:DUF3325 family protein n=2 Tax=root TaxID=1 RepID=A0A7C1VYI1_9GAMM|nr:DUF3325 family protein [Methylophaga aminisulfidivorans]
MIMSFLMSLESMMLLALVQHSKMIFDTPLTLTDKRILRVLAGLLLLIAVLIWIADSSISIGFSHAIMLFGTVGLVPIFMLSYGKKWLFRTVILLPLIGLGLGLFHVI